MVMLVPRLSKPLWRAALGAFLTSSCLSSYALAMEQDEETMERKPNQKGHNVRWGKNTEIKMREQPSHALNNNNISNPLTDQLKAPMGKPGTQLRRDRNNSVDKITLDGIGEQKFVSPQPTHAIIYGFKLDTGPINKSDPFDESSVSSVTVTSPPQSSNTDDLKDTKMGEAEEPLQFPLELED